MIGLDNPHVEQETSHLITVQGRENYIKTGFCLSVRQGLSLHRAGKGQATVGQPLSIRTLEIEIVVLARYSLFFNRWDKETETGVTADQSSHSLLDMKLVLREEVIEQSSAVDARYVQQSFKARFTSSNRGHTSAPLA